MKQTAPAAERNRVPIGKVLQRVLPASGGLLLEVASGTGQHAVHFAQLLDAWRVQPTDASEDALRSQQAWRAEAAQENLLPPLPLDVCQQPWPVNQAQAIFNANMIHIAPWKVTLALLDGAAAVLDIGGLLIMYGPYLQRDVVTAPGNVAFDRDLRARNPLWGVRSLEEVAVQGAARGLQLAQVEPMPANNLTVVYTRVA